MKKHCITALSVLLFFFSACTAAGQKYIVLTYSGDPAKTGTGKIGITEFYDSRTDVPQGYIGRRLLINNNQETYFVAGTDLGRSLADTVSQYIRKKGFEPVSAAPWELTPEGVSKAPKSLTRLVTGTISRFDVAAEKKGVLTEMVLTIDLTFYVGIPGTPALKTVPVTYSLEKTELRFTKQKLEKFVNRAVKEIIQKAALFD